MHDASPNDPTASTPGAPAAGDDLLRQESELRAVLKHRTNEIEALAGGLRLALATAPLGLPVVIAYALISGFVSYAVIQFGIGAKEMEPAMLDLWGQITLGLGGLASVYAVIQFAKRDSVSRASWWPSLFALPLLMLSGAFHLIESGQATQLGPIVLQLFVMAWSLLWMSFGGAATAIAWLIAGKGHLDGRPVGFGALFEQLRSRLTDVAAPHGARVLAVTIGIQLLLPGIFYALQLAFVDMIAVLDPERPAMRRSGQLTFGMRGRLFRMMLLWWICGMALTMAVSLPLEGAYTLDAAITKAQELLIDLSAASQLTVVLQELIWGVLTWILTLALLVLYLEREAQVRAKSALKKLKASG